MENLDSTVFSDIGKKLCEDSKSHTEYNIDVFVEISKNSHVKYEYDKDKKALVCDRILQTPFKYKFNYGFVPNTLSDDGDPIDVVILMDDEIVPGSYINCKLIGFLETEDDSGIDPKLIMCPSKKVDPSYISYNNILDINLSTRDKIKYFFTHYKDLENKTVKIGDFKNKTEAIKIYEKSVEKFNVKPLSFNFNYSSGDY